MKTKLLFTTFAAILLLASCGNANSSTSLSSQGSSSEGSSSAGSSSEVSSSEVSSSEISSSEVEQSSSLTSEEPIVNPWTVDVNGTILSLTPYVDGVDNKVEVTGSYTVHGKYMTYDDIVIFYGECDETNGTKAVWKYIAGDAELTVTGGYASAYRIAEDLTLTQLKMYALELRGSQAYFVYDSATPREMTLVSTTMGLHYATGPCLFLEENVIFLYGVGGGTDTAWAPMLWPAVKGGFKITASSEATPDAEDQNFVILPTYYTSEDVADESRMILLDDNRCACVSVSAYGAYTGIGNYVKTDTTITLSGDCLNPSATGATSVWAQKVGVWDIDVDDAKQLHKQTA